MFYMSWGGKGDFISTSVLGGRWDYSLFAIGSSDITVSKASGEVDG